MKRSLFFICPLIAGSLFLAACGSDKAKTADTTVAVAETTAVVETTLAPVETTAAVETTLAPVETTVAEEVAAGADTTVAAGSEDEVASFLLEGTTEMGFADPQAGVVCMREKVPNLTAETLQDSQVEFFRALIACADDGVIKKSADEITNPVTDEEKMCIIRTNFTVTGELDDTKLMEVVRAGDSTAYPEDYKTTLADRIAKDCGLTKELALEIINTAEEEDSSDTTIAP
jgi:hypothetical protein